MLPLLAAYTGTMKEIPKLLAGDLEYIFVEPKDEQWHDLATQRGYYLCNTDALPDETDPDEYRNDAEVTLNRLLPWTDSERRLQDRWRVQISEWGAREFANHALYRLMSSPTLQPDQSSAVLGKSYAEARQRRSLAFRFGNDPDAFGYSRPAKRPGAQSVQELSILPVDLAEYQTRRIEVIQALGNVAWQHGLRAYVARETLKISAYWPEGEPIYKVPQIRFGYGIQTYKEAALGLMELANQEPYAEMHQIPIIKGTQFSFAVTPWPRTRVRMQPGYFEYRVPGRFAPEDARGIEFLRDALDLAHGQEYSIDRVDRVEAIPTKDQAVVMRPGESFVRSRDQTLLDSMGFMVRHEDGSVRITNFWEHDYSEVIGELFGRDVDSHTVMTYLNDAGMMVIRDGKLRIDESKLPDFVSTLPAQYRRRFMTNPQAIIAKANQRLSVFDADVMPAVTVGHTFKEN